MFGKKKKEAAAAQEAAPEEVESVEEAALDPTSDVSDSEVSDSDVDGFEDDSSEAEEQAEMLAFSRENGPYDATEVSGEEDPNVVDLGAIRVPLIEDMEIRVEVDEETNAPVAVTLVHGEGAVQVRPFASARSGGLWSEAREDIRAQVTGDGGTVNDVEGEFGSELRAHVGMADPEGNGSIQPIRFVGIDGPRWMLQGVFLGQGTNPEAADGLNEVFRSIIVVRGDGPMAMGSPIPLVLPTEVPGDVEEVDGDEEVPGADK